MEARKTGRKTDKRPQSPEVRRERKVHKLKFRWLNSPELDGEATGFPQSPQADKLPLRKEAREDASHVDSLLMPVARAVAERTSCSAPRQWESAKPWRSAKVQSCVVVPRHSWKFRVFLLRRSRLR